MLEMQFVDLIERDSHFQKSKEIISLNCEKRVWLIGGSVFRSLTSILYGTEKPKRGSNSHHFPQISSF